MMTNPAEVMNNITADKKVDHLIEKGAQIIPGEAETGAQALFQALKGDVLVVMKGPEPEALFQAEARREAPVHTEEREGVLAQQDTDPRALVQ